MSKQQQPQEEPIVIENGFVFYVMRILSMAALQMKYADMITIETKMVNEKKYYFNILKKKNRINRKRHGIFCKPRRSKENTR